MKRLWITLGWTVFVEAAWAVILILIAKFVIDKIWLTENFLGPEFLRQEQGEVMGYADELASALISASVVIFLIAVICSVAWHVWGAYSRIDGPAQAAGLRWIQWLLPFLIGALLSLAAVYHYIQTIDLVADQAMIELYIVGFILFFLSYYIGTLFPTAPKLRPAVPLGTLVPALPGY